jgi:hypothetical protein
MCGFPEKKLSQKPEKDDRKNKNYREREVILLPVAAASSSCVNLNGVFLTCFLTAPLRRHCTQTRTVFVAPFAAVVRTSCKLGLKARREMPVTFVPTPPRYFALPRVST